MWYLQIALGLGNIIRRYWCYILAGVVIIITVSALVAALSWSGNKISAGWHWGQTWYQGTPTPTAPPTPNAITRGLLSVIEPIENGIVQPVATVSNGWLDRKAQAIREKILEGHHTDTPTFTHTPATTPTITPTPGWLGRRLFGALAKAPAPSASPTVIPPTATGTFTRFRLPTYTPPPVTILYDDATPTTVPEEDPAETPDP